MTQDETTALFYIHYHNALTDETGHHTGTYSREMGEIWVKSLNADKANRAMGLTHWLEPAAADENFLRQGSGCILSNVEGPNGVERGPVAK